MAPSAITRPLAVFFSILFIVSHGSVVDIIQPVPFPNPKFLNPSLSQMQEERDRLQQEFQDLSIQRDETMQNFEAQKNTAVREKVELEGKIKELLASIQKASIDPDHSLAKAGQATRNLPLFVQVANDEMELYKNKLEMCTSTGRNPSFTLPLPEQPDGNSEDDKAPSSVKVPDEAELVPGVRRQMVDPVVTHITPNKLIAPTTPKPTTTPEHVYRTIPPIPVSGLDVKAHSHCEYQKEQVEKLSTYQKSQKHLQEEQTERFEHLFNETKTLNDTITDLTTQRDYLMATRKHLATHRKDA